jgi:hypothetical protein
MQSYIIFLIILIILFILLQLYKRYELFVNQFKGQPCSIPKSVAGGTYIYGKCINNNEISSYVSQAGFNDKEDRLTNLNNTILSLNLDKEQLQENCDNAISNIIDEYEDKIFNLNNNFDIYKEENCSNTKTPEQKQNITKMLSKMNE